MNIDDKLREDINNFFHSNGFEDLKGSLQLFYYNDYVTITIREKWVAIYGHTQNIYTPNIIYSKDMDIKNYKDLSSNIHLAKYFRAEKLKNI
jgi:hypothetical protein